MEPNNSIEIDKNIKQGMPTLIGQGYLFIKGKVHMKPMESSIQNESSRDPFKDGRNS